MNITGPIKAILDADATADALLDGRIYPAGRAVQNPTYPYATVQVLPGGRPSNTKSGFSTLDQIMIQISVWSTTYQSAAETAEAIRWAIDFWSDTVTVGSTDYTLSISCIDWRDMPWDDSELFGFAYDFKVRYARTQPAVDAPGFSLLLEAGDVLLLETGDEILLES
jgi:hypothetical protein